MSLSIRWEEEQNYDFDSYKLPRSVPFFHLQIFAFFIFPVLPFHHSMRSVFFQSVATEASPMTGDQLSQSLLSESTNRLQQMPATISEPYQNSLCGAILHCTPTKCPSAIFNYIRHHNFSALHRSLDVYHQDIIRIRNDNEQVSSLTISDSFIGRIFIPL